MSCNFINWASAANRRPVAARKSSLNQTIKKTDSKSSSPSSSESSKDTGNAQSCDSSNQSTGVKSSDDYFDLSSTKRGSEWRSISEEDYPELDYPDLSPDTRSRIFSDNISTISLDDILDIDMNHLKLEEECRDLELEAQYWEEKVEELERKQYAPEVPETLVESIIQHRKELRNLGLQLYQQNLEFECLSCGEVAMSEHSFQDDQFELMDSDCLDLQMYFMNDENNDNSSHCFED